MALERATYLAGRPREGATVGTTWRGLIVRDASATSEQNGYYYFAFRRQVDWEDRQFIPAA